MNTNLANSLTVLGLAVALYPLALTATGLTQIAFFIGLLFYGGLSIAGIVHWFIKDRNFFEEK